MKPEERLKLVESAETSRLQYSRKIRQLRAAKIPYFDHAPELPQDLISSCRLIRRRQDLVKKLPKGGVVAEIGTDQGVFARHIKEACAPSKLHLFELDISRIIRSNVEAGIRDGSIIVHEGYSYEKMALVPDATFDWIYIDGDHHYEGVKLDIEASLPKLKEGGMLVFNDYTCWSPSSMNRCGVARAVNEFCIANRWELVYLSFQSMMYNDVAIRKKVLVEGPPAHAPTKLEPPKPSPAKLAPVRVEPPKPAPVKADETRPASVKPDAVKLAPAKAEPPKAAQAKPDAGVKPAPVKTPIPKPAPPKPVR